MKCRFLLKSLVFVGWVGKFYFALELGRVVVSNQNTETRTVITCLGPIENRYRAQTLINNHTITGDAFRHNDETVLNGSIVKIPAKFPGKDDSSILKNQRKHFNISK